MAAGKHTKRRSGRRRALIAGSALGAVVAAAAATLTVLVLTETTPPAAAQLEAAFPTVVPGKLPDVKLPASGQSEIVTASGRVLASTKSQPPAPIASLTKVMTAYIVLGDHPLLPGQSGPEITVDQALAASLEQRHKDHQSLIPVQPGEELTELQALQALLVPSADDIADLLAGFDSGTVPAFVDKMDMTAATLGMAHTHYADASGLSSSSVSTAGDQLILARLVMQIPVFAEIVGQRSVTLPLAGTVANYNTLVGTDGFTGIKTGTTQAAGGCLVWSVTRTVSGTPITLRGVVLGQRGSSLVTAATAAAAEVTHEAYKLFTPRTVLPAGTAIYRLTRAGRDTDVVTSRPLDTIFLPGTPVHLEVKQQAPAPAPTPLGQPEALTESEALSAEVTLSVGDPADRADPATGVMLARPLKPPSLRWRLAHAF